MIICAYCRVSTDSEQQETSFENQQSYFAREVEKAGYQLYKIYADSGLTGTKLDNRPEFMKMLHDAGLDLIHATGTGMGGKKVSKPYFIASERTPAFNAIWIKNTSRFARNTSSKEIIDALRAKNVNIHFIDQDIDTLGRDGDLLLSLLQMFDEQESRDKSSKIRAGFKESAKRNRIRGSSKLYGFNYNKAENSLTAIPEEAEVVRLIFDMYENGYGLRRIINGLNDRGIKNREGKPFAPTTIRHILDNEKYAGLNNALKHEAGQVFIDQHYSKPKPRDQYEVKPSDRIEAIISPDQFYRCLEKRESKVNFQKRVGIYSGATKYAQLIHCGECGSVYHANTAKGGKRFYNCSGKRKGGTGFCKNRNITEDQLDLFIKKQCIEDFAFSQAMQAFFASHWVLRRIERDLNALDADRKTAAEKLQAKIDEHIDELDALNALYVKSKNRREQLAPQIDEKENLISVLREKLAEVSKPNDEIINDIGYWLPIYVKLHNASYELKAPMQEDGMRDARQATPEEVLAEVEKLTIYDDEIIASYKLCKPVLDVVDSSTVDFDIQPLSPEETHELFERVKEHTGIVAYI